MPRQLSSFRLVVTAGFAMFSMFFGSGNLVYPLIAGTSTVGGTVWTILGFLITAVSLPFLGLLGMILYEGDYHSFFKRLGRPIAFTLVFMMLALLGPFGVMPRCITVAFGGIAIMTDSVGFIPFSLIFSVLTGALIWQRSRIVDIIAIFLTPLKFGSIILLIIFGLWFGHTPEAPTMMPAQESFTFGLLEGYQTMDLMAAFFFACTIYEYLRMKLQQNGTPANTKHLFRLSLYSSIFGGFLLSIVYVGFMFLGAQYHDAIKNVEPESMLAAIAHQALGIYGMPIVSITLAVSCLATATVLATLFVDFLKEDITGGRLSRPLAIVATMGVTFGLSLLGFQSIRIVLGTILTWIYPFLVLYTVVSIILKLRSREGKNTTKRFVA